MSASLLAAVVHEKQIYIFLGTWNSDGKQKVLQLLCMPVAGGAYKVISKVIVGINDPEKFVSNFWLSPDSSFVTSTAIANDKLYVGTTRGGILVFPLAGGDPVASARRKVCPPGS